MIVDVVSATEQRLASLSWWAFGSSRYSKTASPKETSRNAVTVIMTRYFILSRGFSTYPVQRFQSVLLFCYRSDAGCT